jgi:hypothetical protein
METVEGGDFGGEYSGRSTQRAAIAFGFSSSEAVSQIGATSTGWTVTVFAAGALMYTLCGVFWQQPYDAGISICPHWSFIMRQQARSCALIRASGTIQAIVGIKDDTNSRHRAPNLRITRIRFTSVRRTDGECKVGK